jgi:hypothetical protein
VSLVGGGLTLLPFVKFVEIETGYLKFVRTIFGSMSRTLILQNSKSDNQTFRSKSLSDFTSEIRKVRANAPERRRRLTEIETFLILWAVGERLKLRTVEAEK